MQQKTCIIISGPTAVGKTDFSIAVAQKHKARIISADSRQCFTELNIGVAKPTPGLLAAVPHYFINTHSIHEEVNVKIFEQYALDTVQQLFDSDDVVVMVGGTGLYIKAFCEGLDEVPPVNESIRNRINDDYQRNGIEWLQSEIQRQDPVFFSSGEMRNPQRIIRALEVKISTGRSLIDFHSGKKIKRDFNIKTINLEIPRSELYEKIDRRVDAMMNAGLLKEAESLYPFRKLNALQTVGYNELFDFIEGKPLPGGRENSLENAVAEIKKNTRHFAKRQMTWFKKFSA